MASIDFKKIKSAGELKAMLRHCDNDERLKHEHSNEDIDKEKTHENINYTKLTYGQSCARFDKRIEILDSSTNKNKRKDRVVAFGLTVPSCEGMTREESASFFMDCCKLFQSEFNARNIISAIAHYDEIHSYIVAGEMKESREHLHFYVIPEIDGQLNGKNFSSKKRMIELNKKLEKLAIEKYHKNFLTKEPARKRSVEELKSISNSEQERRIKVRDELMLEIENKSNSLKKTLMELRELEAKRDSEEQAYMNYQEEPFDYPAEIKRKKPLLGKETIEIEASEYDRFVSKVAECEDVLLYSKKREGTISEIETQFKESILEANKVLDEAEQMRNRTESLSKQARHYKKSLESIRVYAIKHDDEKLKEFATKALLLDVDKPREYEKKSVN